MQIPIEVIKEDAKLDRRASKVSEELAKLRWHWTLDESNPDRVSIPAYAKAVGRDRAGIRRMVKGYVKFITPPAVERVPSPEEPKEDEKRSLSEEIARAAFGDQTEAAIDAVAKARGITFQSAKKLHYDMVKRVRDAAREAYEAEKISEADIPGYCLKLAEQIVKSEEADKDRKANRAAKTGLRYVELDSKIQKARRALTEGLKIARQDINWEQDELDLLISAMDALKSLTSLIDLALTGSLDIDWDGELAKIDGK